MAMMAQRLFRQWGLWLSLVLVPAALGGCSYVSLEEGQRMEQQIAELQKRSARSNQELGEKLQRQSEELNKLLEEARRLTTSLADSSQKSDRLSAEFQMSQGKLEEMQRGLDKLFKVLDGLGLNLLVVPKREVPVARKALHELAEPPVPAGSREGA